MKAKELIEILSKHPEADIKIGWEEHVQYSELTGGSEDRIEPIDSIYISLSDGSFVLSVESYLIANKIWPEVRMDNTYNGS